VFCWPLCTPSYTDKIVILLAGGDKSTQAKDIKTALNLAREL
jgi:putative component of toxin-antitoxin plasmid stabilization module